MSALILGFYPALLNLPNVRLDVCRDIAIHRVYPSASQNAQPTLRADLR